MKDLNNKVSEIIEKISNNGELDKVIEKNILSAFDSIIRNVTDYSSDFRKEVEKLISEKLKLSLSNLNIDQYNSMIMNILDRQVKGYFEQTAMAKIESNMKEILQIAPESIKLTDLVDEVKKIAKGDNEMDGEISFHIVDDRDKYYNIYIDPDEGRDKYRCLYQISARKIDKEGIDHSKGDVCEVWGIKVDERDPKKTLFVGPMFGLDKRLLQIYSAGTKLIIDEIDIDPNYGNDY